jgi:Fe-S cluster assembly iron-binding protein IscA
VGSEKWRPQAQSRASSGEPAHSGVRVFSEPTESGRRAIRLACSEHPFEGDQVGESEGIPHYVAPQLVEALDNVVIDIEQNLVGTLVLRKR